MRSIPRKLIVFLMISLVAGATTWYLRGDKTVGEELQISASGTIETVEVQISPEIGGRVIKVYAEEGRAVKAGELLVKLDATYHNLQREQALAGLNSAAGGVAAAEAGLAAAKAGLAAANANHNLIKRGPSEEELAVVRTIVEKAQVAVDAAQQAYDELPERARETSEGRGLKNQLDMALANLANAQAQMDLAQAGPRMEQRQAAWAQVQAARAQVETAQAQIEIAKAQVSAVDAQIAQLDSQIGKTELISPVDGVILSQAIQPGELASPGISLMTVGQMDRLSITVFISEDRYGTILLGQTASVKVDSYPGFSFPATVVKIADRAEFTPRNVQTAEGRRTTVFAVKLALEDASGRLKPGMPADVIFDFADD
jgi:HlyD family secretion protein